MKKFLKIVGIILLILIFTGGVYLFSIKDKINLTVNILRKYSEFINENNIDTKNIVAIELESDKDYKEVQYKNTHGVPLTLDIYEAKKTLKNGSPVLLYVHGGSWVYGTKEIPNVISPLLDAFREEGFVIISTSYELMRGEENFNKQISDIKDTIRWIYKNKEEYNFNTDKIGVIGASSGAHLSLIATYSKEDEFIDDEDLKNYPSNIKFLVDFFGPTDLNTLDMNNVTWDLQQVIDSLGNNKEEIFNKYSAINYVDSNEPNTLIVHSKKDSLVPYSNAEILYNKLLEKKNKVNIITLEGASHDFSEFDIDEIISVGTKMLKFILQNI
ncbi:alpha/beta hydrolase [Clostridium sp. Sa3CUN1]|uniref:Alpha/beta hydrolase n=1 Tax=Clostridium gallinarum TaxID=2762246 RepID=A0ABR8Q3G5_9CLOT|nr:alpha/beta hydrolase [Clostridium gallinarum]MBD7914961.1 alpha/beta hydrolase [Clostridium gallinarum]